MSTYDKVRNTFLTSLIVIDALRLLEMRYNIGRALYIKKLHLQNKRLEMFSLHQVTL